MRLGKASMPHSSKPRAYEVCLFVDQDHEEMVTQNSWMRDRPAGIDFFRVRSTVDPPASHAYIKEPVFTAKFDLALA
jgi:hypothetical protein